MCPLGKVTVYPLLDEEIDYLHSVIEKQELTEIKAPKKQLQLGRNPASTHEKEIEQYQ